MERSRYSDQAKLKDYWSLYNLVATSRLLCTYINLCCYQTAHCNVKDELIMRRPVNHLEEVGKSVSRQKLTTTLSSESSAEFSIIWIFCFSMSLLLRSIRTAGCGRKNNDMLCLVSQVRNGGGGGRPGGLPGNIIHFSCYFTYVLQG